MTETPPGSAPAPAGDPAKTETRRLIGAFIAMVVLLAVAAGLTWLAIVQTVPIAGLVAFFLAISGVVVYARARIDVAFARFARARAAREADTAKR